MRYANDPHRGEDVLVHEFAHAIAFTGLRVLNPLFVQRLRQTYTNAMRLGLWQNTYAASLKEEYWAEGVQSFFDANRQTDPPDGVHNTVNTREELRVYDPELYTLIREVFPVELTEKERSARLTIAQKTGSISLSWNTLPSVVYDLQTSSDFRLWTFVSDPRIGQTNSNLETIELTGTDHNFFRVLLR